MAKRVRGSGTIRKRGRALYLRYRTGGRLIEEVLPRREREPMTKYRERASLELERKTTGLRAGTLTAPTRRTIEELLDAYLCSIKPTVKPRTWETRERHLRLYVLPEFRRVRVDQLNPEDIRRFQQRLLSLKVRGGGTMAVSTARVVMGDFRDCLKYALDGHASTGACPSIRGRSVAYGGQMRVRSQLRARTGRTAPTRWDSTSAPLLRSSGPVYSPSCA